MGGDFAPANVVSGAIEAVRESGGRFSVVLVGREGLVRDEIRKAAGRSGLVDPNLCSVANASEVIDMHDSPTSALKTKRDSSISVGLTLQREGKVDGFVSAGNTGAVMSASTLILGRVKGVARPTIGAMIPSAKDPCLLVDAGANVDCRPRHLFEFGVMGSVYVRVMLERSSPRVGLLSIGEEDSKGNEVTLEALSLFKKSRLNFVGNVEGRDLLKGDVDVVVCDGFVGNVLLKFGESVPEFFRAKFRAFADNNILNKVTAVIARNGLRSVMKTLDYQEHGGVPLLGVNGVSIIGHGRSTPKAFKNMIYRAEEMVRRGVGTLIQNAMMEYSPLRTSPETGAR